MTRITIEPNHLIQAEDTWFSSQAMGALERAEYVRAHLEQIPGQLWSHFDGSIAGHARTSPTSTPRELPTIQIGSQFLLKRRVGGGATGSVWLAENLALQRAVALKLYRRDLSQCLLTSADGKSPWDLARNEARTQARISHPNVLQIHAIHQWEDRKVLEMEYADGDTLESHLANMGLRQVVEIVREVCRGVQAIHEAGYRHADLKPANIFLRTGHAHPWAVGDLGLAEPLPTPGQRREGRLPRPRHEGGTPDYMAPELLVPSELKGNLPDERADIYALGVLLYRGARGTTPFSLEQFRQRYGGDGMGSAKALREFERAVCNDDRPAPKVDQAFDELVLKCLRVKPDERFATADQLRMALEGWLEEADSLARASPTFSPRADLSGGHVPAALGDLSRWHGIRKQHPYRLLFGHGFVGRLAEQRVLDLWLDDSASPTSKERIRCLCELGGAGKSALAWHWLVKDETEERLRGLGFEGALFCSFYEETGFTFEEFLHRTLAMFQSLDDPGEYASVLANVKKYDRSIVEELLFDALDRNRWLIVLDGLEREMVGYRRVHDKAVDPASLQQKGTATRSDRRLYRNADGEFLAKLLQAKQSRFLITTRLVPADLEDHLGCKRDGVVFDWLPAMDDGDAILLWRSHELPHDGTDEELRELFKFFGSHPIVISILAGSIKQSGLGYRAWRAQHELTDVFQELRRFAEARAATESEEQGRDPRKRIRRAQILDVALADLQTDGAAFQVLVFLAYPATARNFRTISEILVKQRQLVPNEQELQARLAELHERGLVGYDAADQMYDMHPVVRSFVWSKTTSADRARNLEATRSAFAEKPFPEDHQIQALVDVDPFVQNFHAFAELGEWEEAWKLLKRLWFPMWQILTNSQGLLDLIRRLFPSERSLPRLRRRADQAEVLEKLASLYLEFGEGVAGVDRSRWAGALRMRLGDLNAVLDNRRSRAWQLLYEGRLFDTELELRRQALEAREQGFLAHVWSCRAWIMLVLAIKGDAEGVLAYLRNLMECDLSQAKIAPRWLMQTVAEAYFYLGRFEEARQQIEQCIGLEEQPDRWSGQHAWELLTLGMVQAELGHTRAARETLSQARDLGERLNYAVIIRFSLPFLARCDLSDASQATKPSERDRLLKSAGRVLADYFEADAEGPYSHERDYALSACEALLMQAELYRQLGQDALCEDAAQKAWDCASCDGAEFVYRRAHDSALAILAGRAGRRREGRPRAEITAERRARLEKLSDKKVLAKWRAPGHATTSQHGVQDEDELSSRLAQALEELNWAAQPHEVRDWWDQLVLLFPRVWLMDAAELLVARKVSLADLHRAWLEAANSLCVPRDAARDLEPLLLAIQCSALEQPEARRVGSLSDAERQTWLEGLKRHFLGARSPQRLVMLGAEDAASQRDLARPVRPKWHAVEKWLANPDAKRIGRAFTDHGFTAEDVAVFLQDVKPRIDFDGAGSTAREWWRVFEKAYEAHPLDVLSLAEALVDLEWSLGAFVDELEVDNEQAVGLAFLRRRRQLAVRRAQRFERTNTAGWEPDRIRQQYEMTRTRLDWERTPEGSRKWWEAFEQENATRAALVLHLAEELAFRRATIHEFYQAYINSRTDSILGSLSFLDYSRLKSAVERQRKATRLTSGVDRPQGKAPDFQGPNDVPIPASLAPLSDMAGWPGERVRQRLDSLKPSIAYPEATDSARRWWDGLETKHANELDAIVHLAEELTYRRATLKEYFLAYVYSKVDHLRAILCFLDYTRAKNEQERKNLAAATRRRNEELARQYPERRARLVSEHTSSEARQWWESQEQLLSSRPEVLHQSAELLLAKSATLEQALAFCQAESLTEVEEVVRRLPSDVVEFERRNSRKSPASQSAEQDDFEIDFELSLEPTEDDSQERK